LRDIYGRRAVLVALPARAQLRRNRALAPEFKWVPQPSMNTGIRELSRLPVWTASVFEVG
jgi:hypothetical protein